MKLYWLSNAPHVGSGYGQQTDIFTRLARQAGHEVIVRAVYGLHAAQMKDAQGRHILPVTAKDYGDDVLVIDERVNQPDVAVVLADIWVYSEKTLRDTNAVFWAPIDHGTIPPAVLAKLQMVKHRWAMSKHAYKLMHEAGLNPVYVPHGIDTGTYKPMDRKNARQQMGWQDYEFIAVTVAANKGPFDRKNLRAMLKAWAHFVKSHPKALLYIHSNPLPQASPYDLERIARFYDIPAHNLRFADAYKMMNGGYTNEFLNQLYNTADVFLLPSKGEGFGIPVIEAQAAGCPVIVHDWTAQSELCGAGWKIEIDPLDDLEYTDQNAEWAVGRPSKIVEALEQAFEKRGDVELRNQAWEFAREYDAKHVWDKYMWPAMQAMMGNQQLRAERTQQRRSLRTNKVAIGMIVRDDAEMLRQHLPIVAQSGLPIVAIDYESDDDSAELLREHGATVITRTWPRNFGEAVNYLIDQCEELGYDGMIRLDADETMHQGDLQYIAEQLASRSLIAMGRLNFTQDRTKVNFATYPDIQYRAWQLHRGIHFQGIVHETIIIPANTATHIDTQRHIFHYGYTRSLDEINKRRQMYAELKGEPFEPLSIYPDGELFNDEQPMLREGVTA